MIDILRTEIKYIISPYVARTLASRLELIMKKDPNSNNNGYIVRSLYFDTESNRDYFDKIEGLENRMKIRLRIYDTNSSFAKLELKEKQSKLQRKRSIIITREEAQAIIKGDYECLYKKDDFGRKLYTIMKFDHYQPVCLVQYQRLAYICDTNETRITLDSCLAANEGNFDLFDSKLQLYLVDLNGNVTLEVKYNHFLLSYIKDIISATDKLSTSNSKYCRSRIFGLKGE